MPEKRVRDGLTDFARQMLLEHYDGRPKTIDELVQVLGVSRETIHRWAARLHLCKQRRDWTPTEDAYLEEYVSRLSLRQLAAKLGRSRASIRARMEVLRIGKQADGYTLASLAAALGCSPTVVRGWLERGWLHARRRQSERPSDFWLITDEDIVAFLLKHGEAMQVHWDRVRWNWLLSVLRSGRRVLRTTKPDEERAG